MTSTSRPLKVGALFAGYGGLERGVAQALHVTPAWVCEFDAAPSRILAARFPGVPNLGDVTTVDWAAVEPVDVLTGGFPCFTAGTPLLTRRGLVPIEDVTTDDEVWTHRARWRRVTAVMSRQAEATVEFRPGFFSTPDHRLWLREPSRVWNNNARQYRRQLGDPQWVPAADSAGWFAAAPVSVAGVAADKPERLTWWQVGRWLADGYTNAQVHVYIGRPKADDVERFPGWKRIEQETAIRLTMPAAAAERDWLTVHFGKGAAGKTIPAFVLALPEEDRRALLEGYWSGDGYDFGANAKRSVSVSPCLTVGVELIAASLGFTTSMHLNRVPATTVIEGRTVNQRPWWSVTATEDDGRFTERDGDWLWRKLRKRPAEHPGAVVFDLTVADDHSFVAAGIVVHNCQDVSHAGKRAGLKDGTRSGLWAHMCDAINTIRPTLVIAENVRGLLSAEGEEPTPHVLALEARRDNLKNALALVNRKLEHAITQGAEFHVRQHGTDAVRLARLLKRQVGEVRRARAGLVRAIGTVLRDLADIGYDAAWYGLRAADVGAPHGRFRVFVLAWPQDDTTPIHPTADPGRVDRGGAVLNLLRTPTAQLAINGGSQHPDKRKAGGHGPTLADEVEHLLPTPAARDYKGESLPSRSGGPALPDLLFPTPRATDGTKCGPNQRGSSGDLMLPSAVTLLPTPVVNDMGAEKTVDAWDAWTERMRTAHGNGNGHGNSLHIEALRMLPTPTSADHKVSGASYAATDTHHVGTTLTDATVRQAERFGQYAPAIARWEAVLGRPAPAPTEPTGRDGAHRLSPRFVEWLMGLPDGWVTGESVEGWRARVANRRAGADQRPVGHRGSLARRTPPVTRNEQLKALGNGVVPQQAAAAVRHLLTVREWATSLDRL